MFVQKIRSRGWLFTFDDLEGLFTNVYVIEGKKHFFVCDTYLGPVPMEEIKNHLYKHVNKLPFIVFNSHYHWDHIWGNCAFEVCPIIGQTGIINMIHLYGKSELFKYDKQKLGVVQIVLPNIVFKQFMAFPEDKITLFSSPGHTYDSASLYDIFDKVLYVGDNIEDPIPYVENTDFEQYINTIEKYESLDYKVLIPGHMNSNGDLPKKRVIKKNVKYLSALLHKESLATYQRKQYRRTHRENLSNLEKLGYEPYKD